MDIGISYERQIERYMREKGVYPTVKLWRDGIPYNVLVELGYLDNHIKPLNVHQLVTKEFGIDIVAYSGEFGSIERASMIQVKYTSTYLQNME